MASSSLVAIIGRESAYTGQLLTWDDLMNSGQRLGPSEYRVGPVDIEPVPTVPGTPVVCPVYTDFDRMLREVDPVILIVATTDSTHDEFVIKGLDKGIKVIS